VDDRRRRCRARRLTPSPVSQRSIGANRSLWSSWAIRVRCPVWAIRALLAAILAVLSASAPAGAQIYETVGTRAQGMGGAFVAVADDATATWWNPACLVLSDFSLVLERARTTEPSGAAPAGPAWRGDTTSFAASFPALGLSFYRLRISETAPRTTTAGAQPGRQDPGAAAIGLRSWVTNQFGATVGQSVGNHLVIASTLKLVRAGLATSAGGSNGGSLDAAAALDVSLEIKADLDVGAMAVWGPLRLGVSAKHLGQPGFGSGASRLELERQARAGLAWVVGEPGAATVLTAAIDADLTRTPTAFGDARHVAAGLEASMPRSRLALRGGVSANTAGHGGTSASAGVSLRLTKEAVYVDGARTFGSDRSRSGWAVGLRLTI
jgi:hypothetical protein